MIQFTMDYNAVILFAALILELSRRVVRSRRNRRDTLR